jgi:hypothetical protein
VACKPEWFLPSVTYTLQGAFILPDVNYSSVWRAGLCRIDPRTPFSYRLMAIGRNGYVVSSSPGAFHGDMTPGGNMGGGATIRIKKWCAHQPVQVTLTGAGPGYARSGKGYRLVVSGIKIRCR